MTEVTIKQHLWSNEALITIANAMSADIDRASLDTAASLESAERERIMIDLSRTFDSVCQMLRDRDVDITSLVTCPKEW
jgi:hypothetical protein